MARLGGGASEGVSPRGVTLVSGARTGPGGALPPSFPGSPAVMPPSKALGISANCMCYFYYNLDS